MEEAKKVGKIKKKKKTLKWKIEKCKKEKKKQQSWYFAKM